MSTDTYSRTLTLYLRAATPVTHRVEEIFERLDALEHAGRIETYRVERLPSEIDLGIGSTVEFIDDSLLEWLGIRAGTNADAPVDAPGFVRTVRHCAITDETTEVLSPPTLCLAVHREGRLVSIYPDRDGDRFRSVEDGLASLETADAEAEAPSSVPAELLDAVESRSAERPAADPELLDPSGE
jgi:hypothetical protein